MLTEIKFFRTFLLLVTLVFSATANATDQSPPTQPETEQKTNNKPVKEKGENAWIDDFQDGVENTVDRTARWFDRFFGDESTSSDDYDIQGRLIVGPRWSAYEGWKVDSSFRAQFRLPQAKQRFSAIIGRGNFDDIVNDKPTSYRGSVIQSNQGDEEWIIGLGFNPGHGETDRLYFSAGIRGGLKADLYTQVRHLWQRRINDFSQLRLRSTLFWRDSDGFGVNERIDWESSLRNTWLARISLDGTYAERTVGVRWQQKAALYHLYAEEKAIATEIFIIGETARDVGLQDAGIRFIHRSEWLREWLFLEVWGGFHWPREELIEVRQRRWMFGIEFAMWYGD